MNPEAASIVTDGMLKGAFDVFGAMFSRTFSFEADSPQPWAASFAAEYPVAFQARIKNQLGAVAMLFTTADAARFAALVTDSAPNETLSDEDVAVLKEVAEPALGGGVSNLMERFGRGVEQLESAEVVAQADAAALGALLGADAAACQFRFSGDDMAGAAVVAFSQSLEQLVPPSLLSPGSQGPTLSKAEVSDILSGFGVAETPLAVTPPPAAPDNLDMVLDIRLHATARLGRVEMPLGDILNLGPGSIIEVGHLVDEPVELLINDKLIARGDVVVVDEKFGLRITEIVSPKARIESLR